MNAFIPVILAFRLAMNETVDFIEKHLLCENNEDYSNDNVDNVELRR